MVKTRVLGRRRQADGFAVDLGTSRTRVWLPGRGVVAEEPSTLAQDAHGRPVAAGWSAWESAVECSAELSWPVRVGVVVDLLGCREMLRMIFDKRLRRLTADPIVVVGVPATGSATDRSAVAGVLGSVAGGRAVVVEEPFAAAVGAGVDVAGVEDRLVVDIGAGRTEVAWIRDGRIQSAREVPVNANDLASAQDSVGAGRSTPFLVLAAAIRRMAWEVTAADSVAGLPPVLVSGGGALVAGVVSRLGEETGLEVTVADDPARVTITGLGQLLKRPRGAARTRSVPDISAGRVPPAERHAGMTRS